MPLRAAVQRVREEAGRLFASEAIGPGLARRSGRLRTPVPIYNPDDGVHSWFVPVTVRGRLVGFLQLLPDLTLMRYAAFQRNPETLEGCPEAATWLDRKRIMQRAATRMRPDERAGPPVLTYDREPSRLAWRVTASDPSGRERALFVAGEYVYEAARPESPEYGDPSPLTPA